MTRRLLPLFAALAFAGCTCAINADQYLDAGERGDFDAGPDAMIDAGELPDGGDAGPPTENVPPEPSGVGLSSYRPGLGTILESIVGPFRDPNNDAVTQDFHWFLDGEEIAGETGPTLTLDATRFGVGDVIELEVDFDDGELVTTIDAGPAVIVDDSVTRWNLLLPPRSSLGSQGTAVFDAVHQRMLWRASTSLGDYGVWEYQLTHTGLPGRWVRLHSVTGVPPEAVGNMPIPDPEGGRVLFFGGRIPVSMGPDMEVDRLWSLDVDRQQGAEAWAEIPPNGDVPSPRGVMAFERVSFSDGEEAFVFYGGLSGEQSGTPMVHDELFVLHVEDGDRWEQIRPNVLPMPRLIPITFFDPATGLLYLAGGAEFGDPVRGTTDVFVMDVDDLASGATDTGWDLPGPRFGGDAVVVGDTAYIFGGAEEVAGDMATVAPDVVALNLTDGSSTELGLGALPAPLAFGQSRAPYGDGVIVYNRGFNGETLRFFEIDPAAMQLVGVTGEGIDMPPPMTEAVGVDRRGPGAGFWGGRMTYEGPPRGNRELWAWDGLRFETLAPMGMPPMMPLWGFSFDATEQFARNDIYVVGGQTDGGTLAPMEAFRARLNDEDWQRLPLRDMTAPAGHFGHTLFRGHCQNARGNFLGVVGGAVGSLDAPPDDQTYMLECATGMQPTMCTWYLAATINANQATSWGAATQLELDGPGAEHTFLFGGWDGANTPTNQAYYLDACTNPMGTPRTWAAVNIQGDIPPEMGGHTLTGHPSGDPEGDPTTAEAFLMFGAANRDASSAFSDVYRMTWNGDTGAPVLTFERITPAGPETPSPRAYHVAVYEADQDRILVYGGTIGREVSDDLWELRLR